MKLPGDISAFKLIEARLDMLGARQKTVSENVANANTPGFVPRDINMTDFQRSLSRVQENSAGQEGLVTTHRMHYDGAPFTTSGLTTQAAPDSEVTMDGNAVVVEEQMLKINQIRTDFDTAMSLYQKGLALIRLASRAPN